MILKDGISDNNYLFTGEEFDLESGNYYLRARYYSPISASFISVDPFVGDVGNPITLNKYLYGNGNPEMFSDPSGNYSLSESAIVQKGISILSTLPVTSWKALAVSAGIGGGASGLGYGASIVFWLLSAPEKSFSELWSWRDFGISVGSGVVTGVLLEVKVVAQLGVITVNVFMNTATGIVVRSWHDDQETLGLAPILTDIIGGFAIAAAGGNGKGKPWITSLRGILSGPAGSTATTITSHAIEGVKTGAENVNQYVNEMAKQWEWSIRKMYGIQ